MEASGGRRKIVHVKDVFSSEDGSLANQNGNHETVLRTKGDMSKEMPVERPKGIYMADGVTNGLKSQKEPGRKKRQAPKPPGKKNGCNGVGNNVVGTKDGPQISDPFADEKVTNLLGCMQPEFDPVTGLRMRQDSHDADVQHRESAERLASQGFILTKGKVGSDRKTKYSSGYFSDITSPADSVDEPFSDSLTDPLNASSASHLSTRASSGYCSDSELKDSPKRDSRKASKEGYQDIQESDIECVPTIDSDIRDVDDPLLTVLVGESVVKGEVLGSTNSENGEENSDEFEEEEMTMEFGEEEDPVEGTERKLYTEYVGDDYSMYLKDEPDLCRKKHSKTKHDPPPLSTDTKDAINTSFKGTLLGFTSNSSKRKMASFDKLSAFSYADSKFGSAQRAKDNQDGTKESQKWWNLEKHS